MAGAATVVDILGTIPDPALRFDFLWAGIGGATEADAIRVMPTGPEPRVRSWWDGAAQSSLDLGLDDLLLYEAGRTWPEGAPSPGAADFTTSIEIDFDGDAFREAIVQRLPDCESVETR